MFIQKLLQQDNILNITLLVILIFPWQAGLALSSDKNQPIEIEANTGELDDINNTSIYTGNVIVIQGSLRMTGDKMTVYYTEDDEIDTLIMEGRPATYRQLPDNSTVYDEAEALIMEYYEIKNLIVLINNALVIQEGSRFSGQRIEYDTILSQVKGWSTPSKEPPTGTSKKSDRVKVIIKPKSNAEK